MPIVIEKEAAFLHFEPNEQQSEATPDLKGKTLLVVEDVVSNYQLVQAYLGKSGAEIIHVDNGLDAVDTVKSRRHIDLIIMDIRLPKLNGLVATREIRKTNPRIPIIAQTAFAMQSDREMCLSAGCDEFIAKPFRRQELMRILARFV